MAKTTIDKWSPDFLNPPLFAPLKPLATQLKPFTTHWPSLDDYQQLLATTAPIYSKHSQPIRFVPQGDKPQRFDDQYEVRIFLKGEVQTRRENWHDFFQVLVWRTFPKTKVELNAGHFNAALVRKKNPSSNKNRSPIENAITLFDECGAIIISSNPYLLELIKQHQWKELFWLHREHLNQQLRCIVFGHAMYEKALTPYVGMTAHCLLLEAEQNILNLPTEKLNAYCDTQVSQRFAGTTNDTITSPKDLSPFPLLGIADWYPDNQHECFYDNTQYFRPKKFKRNEYPKRNT